ncbi:MAG: DUF1501 domain-containing protein [Planctomycetia bacterium]|nr:DUF1501 domain-containing protein [Planctomycetia bacterium]
MPCPADPADARRADTCRADGSLFNLATRRDLLRLGSLTLAASVVPRLPFALGRAAETPEATKATAKSVIFLWMGGGVTHIDSFDPKPSAPAEIRGTLTDIATCLPGVRFCETLPNLAKIADLLAVVRSFSHDSNDHLLSQVYTLSGRKVTQAQLFSEPNIGSIVEYLLGPRGGLPGYIAVPGITRPGPPPYAIFVGGWLGPRYAPFCVGGEPAEPDFTKSSLPEIRTPDHVVDEDLRPKALELLTDPAGRRLMDRSQLRGKLDGLLTAADRAGALEAADSQYQSALNLLLSPKVREAFDLMKEPEAVRVNYGRTKIGARCLLARRLVELGARFVMVDYGYDPQYGNLWDNHRVAVQKQPHICEMVKYSYHLGGTEKAVAALLLDLKERGLLDSTLVVFLTEFGRTPKINKDGGRDHWGAAGSMFFAGGGTRGGQVIGATDKEAAYPTGPGYTPADIAATIYRAIGIDAETRVYDRQNRPAPVLPEGQAIPGVLA